MNSNHASAMDGPGVARSSADRSSRLRPGWLVVLIFLGTVGLSQLLEWVINRVLRPDLEEWSWISEIFVIAALFVVTVQWVRLRVARTALADLERERLMIRAELAIAARVQRAMLPAIPAPADGMSWYAVMEPAGQVGGDYYDFFPVDGGRRMCVVLADVSGKGVPAAVFMSNTRAALRAISREQSSPSAILAAVSEILRPDAGGRMYVTCFLAIVEADSRTVVYANAGHPPGVILREGSCTRVLDAGGPPLGLIPSARYVQEEVVLTPRDLVILVSDGITEALDASGDEIPEAICRSVAHSSERSAASVCVTLSDTARRSPGPRGVPLWADDRTVVAFG